MCCVKLIGARTSGGKYTVVDRAAHAELTLTPRRATSRRRCFGLGLRCGRDPAGPCRLIVCFRGLGIPTRPSGILIRGPLAQLSLKGLRLNKRTPIARVALRRHSTDNKQAQESAACACMLLHCCAALMHRADACAALQLLLLPVCCGACSRRPPCIIRVARRRLATQMCLCRGCYQTWRWHLRPCAHRHTADTRPRTRDTRA